MVNRKHAQSLGKANLEARSGKALAEVLRSPNLTRRHLATELIIQRGEMMNDADSELPASAAHGLWIGARLGKISATEIKHAMNNFPVAAVHGFKMLGAFSGNPGIPGYYAHTLPEVDVVPSSLGSSGPTFYSIGRFYIDPATGREIPEAFGEHPGRWTPHDF
ncbi:MAG: hypothetical protein HC841_08965, partial [Verrucomicrobiae bacterium]|nr:hypothetical protein [Verrucomicrobiae bacterium]